MSWQSYIDDQLLAAGCMYATINSHSGDLWACSPGFTMSASECTTLSNVLKGTDLSSLGASGFTVAGQKYAFTRGEVDDEEGGASFLQGRCKEEGKSSQGVIVYCTGSALIVGVHDPAFSDGATFAKVNTDMGRIADYMIETGF